MIIDVDYFKPYNDNYGHQKGDNVLQAIAKSIKEQLRRAGDFAFRIGGEEFGVIVSADDSKGILKLAEKLRKAIEDLKLEHNYSETSPYMTVSIGVKMSDNNGTQPADMDLIYRLADEALYQAKESGRNRIVGHHDATDMPADNENQTGRCLKESFKEPEK